MNDDRDDYISRRGTGKKAEKKKRIFPGGLDVCVIFKLFSWRLVN